MVHLYRPSSSMIFFRYNKAQPVCAVPLLRLYSAESCRGLLITSTATGIDNQATTLPVILTQLAVCMCTSSSLKCAFLTLLEASSYGFVIVYDAIYIDCKAAGQPAAVGRGTRFRWPLCAYHRHLSCPTSFGCSRQLCSQQICAAYWRQAVLAPVSIQLYHVPKRDVASRIPSSGLAVAFGGFQAVGSN
jgi:hypothetical protein